MNKRSRKTKGLSHRLIALLLCCVCLITAMPVSAIALETDIALVAEKIDTEKPTEEVIVEPEVTATVAPTPTALSNLEDTSVDGGNSDTALETTTGSTTEPVTEYTVTFSVGDDAAAADVPAPSSATVTGGQTISDLPEPVWKGEDGQFVKVFAGWYSDEALTTEFTSETVVNADTTLHAKWVEPEAEGVYYVNFYSQDGQTVHQTLSAMAGKTVAPAQGPTLVGKVFKGWSTTMQGDSPVADLNAFDFNTPISDAVNQGANGKTLNLYAWYAKSVTVSFIANGGTAVPSQIIAEGDTAASGQTTRTGYTFRGWSTDKDTYTAFDFTTPVNEDLTLYAFWNADLVSVTIVYMYENPNDAEYSPAGKSAKVYAPAGSYVSVEKNSNITDLNGTHAVRYAETMNGELTGYAKQSADANSRNATIPDIQDTYFQYDHASNKRWVNPDGSTTVLVYYNRARVTLTFAYDQNSTTASIEYTSLITEANRTKYAVSYTQDSTSKFTYSFTAKYGEDITAVWPQVGWVKDSNGNTPSYSSDRDTDTFYAWECPDTSHQSSNMYTLEANLFIGGNSNENGLKIVDGKLVGTGTLPDAFTSVKKDWLIYARTTLPGETVDFIYGGKNYTIYKEACQLGYTQAGRFGYKSLNGCTPISGKPTLLDQYGSSMSIDKLSVNTGSSLKAKFDETFPNQISSGDNCQVLLYDRNNLTLNVWTNDDTHSATGPQNETYLYGDKIYNEDTDLLKSLETTMTKAGYVFAGWYTTSEFTPGTEYKPDENSAITANMNLYAKWEPNQFRAEYYLYMDDAAPYAWQGFAEGGKIDDKLVPSAVQDSFLGWYWYQNGQLVPFDFTSAVGANHVDENGVLKLYAKWSGTNGKVSYLPGIGGDNATQEVVDERDFAINEASVQLPQYTSVWSSGVPTDTSLTFVGWKAPNGAIYQPGRYVLVTRNLMRFEAQWSTDAVKLIYNANGGSGDDVTENWARNSVVSIWDNMDGTTPHFTRKNYTLLGWDENPSATTPTYQLGQGSITLDKNVTTLYAIWKLNTVELTIQKTVSGNMYNANDVFSFTLHYGEKPKTFTLKGGESKTFQVPVGAKVTVTEDLTKSNGYIPSNGTGTTVTLTTASEKDGIFKFTMPEEDGKLVINNDKTVTVDTGVLLDTLPYILILGVVAVGAVLLIKRRRNRDDD
ncbi:repeat TIGR02543 family [Firmicutes bacterium CAG:646]|nr:repeat TIGR02543 family [Firmicutes bacterium CAG:646]